MYGFVESIQRGFANTTTFHGRATRSEWWWWLLFVVLVSLVLSLGTAAVTGDFPPDEMGQGAVYVVPLIFQILVLLPTAALVVRRFHDLDRTGWWVLLWLAGAIGGHIPVPIVSGVAGLIGLAILIWFIFRGTEGDNQYGPDPLQAGG